MSTFIVIEDLGARFVLLNMIRSTKMQKKQSYIPPCFQEAHSTWFHLELGLHIHCSTWPAVILCCSCVVNIRCYNVHIRCHSRCNNVHIRCNNVHIRCHYVYVHLRCHNIHIRCHNVHIRHHNVHIGCHNVHIGCHNLQMLQCTQQTSQYTHQMSHHNEHITCHNVHIKRHDGTLT